MLLEEKTLVGSPDISYRVDAEDCITEVSDGWIEFAKANDGRLLLPPEILGTVLWDWIYDAQTRHVYRTLLQRARASTIHVRFQFRCDSPAERRLLHMEIVPMSNGEVEFQTSLISSEVREPVELLKTPRAHSDSLLKICGWCMRIQSNDSWLEIEDAISDLGLFEVGNLPNLSHGMCPACYGVMLASFEKPTMDEAIP
jgi:hypothetical protein